MLRVFICGHDSHHRKPCNIFHSHGLSNYLLLLVKTDAWFFWNGEKQKVIPNTVLLFPPGIPVHYGCDLPGYNDDWIHFQPEGENSTAYLRMLKLPYGTAVYPGDFHCLTEYARLMAGICFGDSEHKKELLDHFMCIFLRTLAEDIAHPHMDSVHSRYYLEFSKLRTQIYNAPADKRVLQQMADSMHLSVSYFQHLYKSFFGCSCQQDLIKARLQLARRYLTTTEMCIASLAEFCGYESEVHFMRQFKKFTGVTPTQYRTAHSK